MAYFDKGTQAQREIAETCNAKGIQTYLTVNTVIYGDDSSDICSLSSIDNLMHSLNILAARFTVEVVLPTPPFWFATAMMRVVSGLRNVTRP